MYLLINFALTITLSLVIIGGGEGNKNVLIMLGDDVGFETQIYNNTVSKTPHLNDLAKRSVLIRHAFTSVSSCSPSRAALLTGMPQHQNGMYGLHNGANHFQSFDNVQSLPLILKDHNIKTGWDQAFSSHDMHEVTMFYPMRVIRTHQYRLIHNLNNRAPYPIATDLFMSHTFQDILNRTRHGKVTNWYKNLKTYYYRAEYELYDIVKDPQEMTNLADNGQYQKVFESLKKTLMDWRLATKDPWKCYPHMCLHDDGTCQPLYNEIPLL